MTVRFLILASTFFISSVIAQNSFNASTFQSVNSPNDEQNPVLSPDGKTLFITIRYHAQNIDGKRDPGDIWISTWDGAGWTAPVHGGALLNDRGYNAVAGITADGNQLILLHHYDASGLARTQGISVSRKSSAGWAKPENIFITYFQNKSSFISGHLSSDGNVLVYSAETYGSYGVDDLYISMRQSDGKWSEPRNLGRTINTQFQELCPSLSHDGKTIYFSSNGRKGSGSFDIYSSTRLDDSYTNWSEPINLGTSINTEGRELFYRSYEQQGIALYTSTTNSDGYGDIRVQVNQPPSTDTTLVTPPVVVAPLIEEPKKEEVVDPAIVRIHGKILNAKTGDGISATIRFQAPDQQRLETTSANAGYSIQLLRSRVYSIDVESPGYISKFEKLDLTSVDLNELELNFNLQPIEVGTTVNLKNVLFKQSTPELLPESYPELDLVVEFMRANPNVEIELAGHTDNRGSYRQLMDLSQKRVNRVKDYLVSKGIDKKRITGKGYGGSKPVASNETEDQRMLNRRVEFMIKKL
jgi:outer membrane protein OmpA-like peptidoglycan-associated protein